MKIFLILILLLTSTLCAYDKQFRYRKYTHVKLFYSPIINETIKIALKHNMPPAAILAIASVESGYGRGYVASITGNILSLGANKGDRELPSVYLPNTQDPYKVLYNTKEIDTYSKKELTWKQRPKSLKKDYRPSPYAGTTKELDYFDYHQEEKQQANLKNIEEFCTRWISLKNRHAPFKEARAYLNKQVELHGKEILFSKELNLNFINKIGGRPHSFNYRKTWPKKVSQVLKHTGLVSLTYQLSIKKTNIKEVW